MFPRPKLEETVGDLGQCCDVHPDLISQWMGKLWDLIFGVYGGPQNKEICQFSENLGLTVLPTMHQNLYSPVSFDSG